MVVNDETWKKWQRWVEKIHEDLSTLVNDAAVFNGFREVVIANGDWIDSCEGGLFMDFIKRNYVHSATAGIRRHLKAGPDEASFQRLLEQLHAAAPRLIFDDYLKRFPRKPNRANWQKAMFAKFSEDGGSTVSANLVQRDIDEIATLNTQVEHFADRAVAHLDKRGHTAKFTFDDLAKSIDGFNRLACKYSAFLTGHVQDSLEAKILFRWEKVFENPWVKPLEARNA